ncbi:MAG TPA: hypothetical protein VMW69_15530 [Spirochaetia bacterium]|nr:hypothetical protein [Spirochaetia bacterium]
MQQVIEEILKTEEDCANRLETARKATETRRAEIDAENAERVRRFREEADSQSAERIRSAQASLNQETEAAITRSREKAERELDENQILVDRIVDRIVGLVTGTNLED